MAELIPTPKGYPIKVVRDCTAEIINSSGKPGDLWYAPAPNEGRSRLLRLKLAEEVAEYLVDGGSDELADVYAVVLALGAEHGANLNKLYLDDERGGFHDVVVMYGRHDEFDAGPMPRGAVDSQKEPS